MEWISLILLVSVALAALAWLVGPRLPRMALEHSIAERMICAVRLTEDCRNEPVLRTAHGAELAALLRDHAPALLYEDGMTALPVDFRRCRSDGCAAGARDGAVSRSDSGERTVAFTHVIDCRPGHVAATRAWGGNCSGPRAGNLYLQYWLYYPGSATAEGSTPLKGPIRSISGALGHSTFHPDDWEGVQVRVGAGGVSARATSHHGYNGWDRDQDVYYISGGSHAGRTGYPLGVSRTTKDHRLILVPIETLAGRDAYSFAISPPWRKRVYFDPEASGTS